MAFDAGAKWLKKVVASCSQIGCLFIIIMKMMIRIVSVLNDERRIKISKKKT